MLLFSLGVLFQAIEQPNEIRNGQRAVKFYQTLEHNYTEYLTESIEKNCRDNISGQDYTQCLRTIVTNALQKYIKEKG